MGNNSEINHLIAEILSEECEKEDNQDVEEIIDKVLHRAIEYSATDKIPAKECDKIFQKYV